MKKNIPWIIIILLILFSFGLYVLGLMNIVPLLIGGPVLFLSLLLFFIFLNDRKRFKGF